MANWPPAEREAARAPRLTRAQAAELVWWMVPEVREARGSAAVIASDAVSRRDSRPLTRAVALGLLEVDPETHRVSPDAHLYAAGGREAARPAPGDPRAAVGRDAVPSRVRRRGLLANAEAVRLAQGCGLIPEREGGNVGGTMFLRALDRRALGAGGETRQ